MAEKEKEKIEAERMSESTPVPMDLLRGGATVVRFENETQMAIAIQRPRDIEKIRNAALKELDTFPDMAEDVIYLAPVGKDENKVMQYAEELNIRAAENLFRLWGNASCGVMPLSEDDDKVTFVAVMVDYETNGRLQRFGYASKKYKSAEGRITVTAPDRFAKTTLPAAISRVLRETILRSLPHGLKEVYKEKAYEIFGKKYNPEECKELWKTLVKSFADLKITESELGTLCGKPAGKNMTARDILRMRTLYQQIKTGEIKKSELFDDLKKMGTEGDPLAPGRHQPEKNSKEEKKPEPSPVSADAPPPDPQFKPEPPPVAPPEPPRPSDKLADLNEKSPTGLVDWLLLQNHSFVAEEAKENFSLIFTVAVDWSAQKARVTAKRFLEICFEAGADEKLSLAGQKPVVLAEIATRLMTETKPKPKKTNGKLL
jgi:hypothetical protein